MTIIVESELTDLTPGLKFDLERRLGRLYRKASNSVRKVRVKFAEVNSPEGKLNKQCQLVLTLAGAPGVMVVARKSTIEKAFAQALDRANMALAKRKQVSPGLSYQVTSRSQAEEGFLTV